MKEKTKNKEEWEIIDKEKVMIKYTEPKLFSDGMIFYKTEYIIKNKKTGEVRRI